MSKWVHRLTNKDIEKKIADCANCGKKIRIVETGRSKRVWRCFISRKFYCKRSSRLWNYKNRHPYRVPFMNLEIKKCNKCEMQNSDLRFFDVNHIDGDHDNNVIDNLELLCPNCHRTETLKQWAENGMKKYNRNRLGKVAIS